MQVTYVIFNFLVALLKNFLNEINFKVFINADIQNYYFNM